jgi:formylglycine-generating enzyme required for sulfatase activity
MVSPVDGMVLVYVPEGTFLMGSAWPDPNANEDEAPQHEVYLDSFWIDRTEVTNAMYADFLNARGGNRVGGDITWLDADAAEVRIHPRGDRWEADVGYEDHPVVYVTWYGARAYCDWAGRRLPTEAEWEKAARGTEGQLYPWGNEPPNCSLAQYWGCSGETVPVGSKPDGESPYGAWDMAGNVWEWVSSLKGNYPYEGGDGREDPYSEGPRVLRGSSLRDHPGNIRAAVRARSDPGDTNYHMGFRCSRSP